ISKQLAIIKQLGLISATRKGTWMIYQLTTPENTLLSANLEFLRKSHSPRSSDLRSDLEAREALIKELTGDPFNCEEPIRETLACCK
ncbi:MAG: hypothetical protein AAGC73_10370, partial [Verrucomicrobiota bacterium]